MEWQKYYSIQYHYLDKGMGGRAYFYDVFDIDTGRLIGTFEDEDLAKKHAQELCETKVREAEKILLGNHID